MILSNSSPAVANVENHYSVVGVLEEMEKSLTVLEHYLPLFFSGALKEYHLNNHRWRNVNRNAFKPKVLADTVELYRKNMTRETEFYHYCKQRLHKQYLALGLS